MPRGNVRTVQLAPRLVVVMTVPPFVPAPTATQSDDDAQETPKSCAGPLGTDSRLHVMPPVDVARTAPVSLFAAPTATQSDADAHESPYSADTGEEKVACLAQVVLATAGAWVAAPAGVCAAMTGSAASTTASAMTAKHLDVAIVDLLVQAGQNRLCRRVARPARCRTGPQRSPRPPGVGWHRRSFGRPRAMLPGDKQDYAARRRAEPCCQERSC